MVVRNFSSRAGRPPPTCAPGDCEGRTSEALDASSHGFNDGGGKSDSCSGGWAAAHALIMGA